MPSRFPDRRAYTTVLQSPKFLVGLSIAFVLSLGMYCFRETRGSLGARYVLVRSGDDEFVVRVGEYRWEDARDGAVSGRSIGGGPFHVFVVDPAGAELIERYKYAPRYWWSWPR